MRRFLFFLVLTFYCNFIFAQATTNGLVAYYTFDGNANDLSGSNNHGILYNCVPELDRSGNSLSNSVSFFLPTNFTGNTFSTYDPNIGSGIIIENSSSLILSNQFSVDLVAMFCVNPQKAELPRQKESDFHRKDLPPKLRSVQPRLRRPRFQSDRPSRACSVLEAGDQS